MLYRRTGIRYPAPRVVETATGVCVWLCLWAAALVCGDPDRGGEWTLDRPLCVCGHEVTPSVTRAACALHALFSCAPFVKNL